ncbi:MAG: type II toxin-antitoxin system RelE/ParE family toxin [Candidatus Nitrospinota bacterium M3_3B_026]
MIKGFRSKGLGRFYRTGSKAGIAPAHAKRLRLILAALDNAREPRDMGLPGFGLHELSGKRKGYWSVSVSGNWRVIFCFDGENVTDIDYLDYH